MDNQPLGIEALPGQSPGQVIMTLKGPLILNNVFSFQDAVRAEKSPVVILDLSNVSYMDSAGLGLILNAHVSRSNSGRRLALVAVPDRVLTMIRVARVDQVLSIFPTLQEAKEKMA